MTTGAGANLYDAIPYPSFALPQTYPDRLATLGTLFGMAPAPIDRCRVLELGCGDGANLIPMALGLPGSAFVGIDLAARPIARAEAMAAALGLRNVALHHRDIQDISGDIGAFDYIIAHGLYSWVPPPVRETILAICAANLRPDGIAYVSYNTYPGGRLREITREMMTFHTRGMTDPWEKIARAREIVRSVAGAQSGEDAYAAVQRAQDARISGLADASILHDYLADVNAPVYFHQFMRQATGYGLQYLAEADFFEMREHPPPLPIAETLNDPGADDLIAREQYLDFLHGRAFRQTLLCHLRVPLDRALAPERVMALSVASPVRAAASAPDIHADEAEEFLGPKGATLTTNHPVSKAALLALGEAWPGAIHFPALLAHARSRAGRDTGDTDADRDADARALGGALIGAYAAGLVELYTQSPAFAHRAGARSVASPLARLQLRDGPIVTTLRHTSVHMDDRRGRDLLGMLDGTRDRAALLAALAGRGEGDDLAWELERDLARLAHLALLVE